jgi:predicted ribosome quality control (RQC) complex YloA/Tae2 family protein
LVKNEKRMDEVKLTEHKRLLDTYGDVVQWLVMLNKNPDYKTQEDLFKSVQFAFKHVKMMNGILDKAEYKLKNERYEIENAMMNQIKKFEAKIAEIKGNINQFKDRGAVKQ